MDKYLLARVTARPTLRLRMTPGGKAYAEKLPTGTYVRYDPTTPTNIGGYTFVQLDTSGLPGHPPEWVAQEYLETIEDTQ